MWRLLGVVVDMILASVHAETRPTGTELDLAAIEDAAPIEVVPVPHLPELQNACARALLSLDPALQGGVIAVVSAGPSDGRAAAAAGVAVALAELTEGPVALAELDFVDPQQARIFGASKGDGLAAYLVDEKRLRVTAVATASPLYLMAAGPPATSPSRCLNAVLDCQLVPELGRRFKWTVLDLPAVMEHGAALAIARLASRRIVVGRHRVSKRRSLQELFAKLEGDEVQTALVLLGRPLRLPAWFGRLHDLAGLDA